MLSFNGKKIMGNLIFGAGMKGETDSAEVFNDYKNNKAVSDYSGARGSYSQAGSRAFTVLEVDYNNKTFTLDDATGLQEALDKKLTYTVLLSTKEKGVINAFKFGKITAINGNVITVDAMPEELNGVTIAEVDPLDNQYGADFEQNTFQIPELPNIGTRRIGLAAFVDGFRCWALRKYDRAINDTCKALGGACDAGGKNTECRCTAGFTRGIGTISCAIAQAVLGTYNKLNKLALFIVGCGTSDKDRRNAVEVYKDKIVLFDDELADYPIEQGTSGIWTYRKWKSGLAECWGVYSVDATINVASGNVFTSSSLAAIDFPFDFIEIPKVDASLSGSSLNAFLMTAGIANDGTTTTHTGRYKIGRSTKADKGTFILNFDVKGKWK